MGESLERLAFHPFNFTNFRTCPAGLGLASRSIGMDRYGVSPAPAPGLGENRLRDALTDLTSGRFESDRAGTGTRIAVCGGQVIVVKCVYFLLTALPLFHSLRLCRACGPSIIRIAVSRSMPSRFPPDRLDPIMTPVRREPPAFPRPRDEKHPRDGRRETRAEFPPFQAEQFGGLCFHV